MSTEYKVFVFIFVVAYIAGAMSCYSFMTRHAL